MAKVDWDQENYGASEGRVYDTLPKGRYLVSVTDSEDKETKSKTGRYFEFEFSVIAPKEFKGRKLWDRFNVHNPSEEAQRIGRETFNALAAACGMMGAVKKTEQLHDKVVVVAVTIDKSGEEPSNKITGYFKHEGAQPSAKPAAGASARPAPSKPAAPAKPAAGKFDDMVDDIPF